jgi:hypothetical protein
MDLCRIEHCLNRRRVVSNSVTDCAKIFAQVESLAETTNTPSTQNGGAKESCMLGNR